MQKDNDTLLQKSHTKSFNKEEFLNVLKSFKYEFGMKPKNTKVLQLELLGFIENHFSDYEWRLEHRMEENRKDSFDIYGVNGGHHIIIELDPHRADSIAKKFVSRIAMTSSLHLTYVCFLYKGTDKMSINEAKKYFSYCEVIVEMLNNAKTDIKKEFIGYCHFKSK